MSNTAFLLRHGKIVEEVDAIRVFVGAQTPSGEMYRRSAVWKFFPAKRGPDMFVTSTGLQSEMKGTVHATRAQFGYTSYDIPEDWIGDLPPSRHLETLEPLSTVAGEFQRIFSSSLPGFALRSEPLPVNTDKRHVCIDAPSPAGEKAFGLRIHQGDLQDVDTTNPNVTFVGMIKVDGGRTGLVSVTTHLYPDAGAVEANMMRNLGMIPPVGRELPREQLGVTLLMKRKTTDPIHIIELNNVVQTSTR